MWPGALARFSPLPSRMMQGGGLRRSMAETGEIEPHAKKQQPGCEEVNGTVRKEQGISLLGLVRSDAQRQIEQN